MRDIYEFGKRFKYPHMSVADTEIWNRFLDKFSTYFDACQYDFHIGEAPPFNTLMDDETDKNQDMLYRLRIDVVGHKGEDRNIIEIKPNAGPSTIGQVQSYKTLYDRDEEPKAKTPCLIITDKERLNMAFLCKQADVELIIV